MYPLTIGIWLVKHTFSMQNGYIPQKYPLLLSLHFASSFSQKIPVYVDFFLYVCGRALISVSSVYNNVEWKCQYLQTGKLKSMYSL